MSGQSGELDAGRVIKTKKNTVALRMAKNKHENIFMLSNVVFTQEVNIQ
jgi:hypothetical protein